MTECTKCLKESELATLDTKVMNISDDIADLKSEVRGLSKIYEMIYQLTGNISLLTDQMGRATGDIETIKKDVEEIKSKPGVKYEAITEKFANNSQRNNKHTKY